MASSTGLGVIEQAIRTREQDRVLPAVSEHRVSPVRQSE